MPRYKVQLVGRNELEIEAHRVVRVGDDIVFERLISAGRWEEVQRLGAHAVGEIRRRVEEAGGFRHYFPVDPVRVPGPAGWGA